MILAAYIINLKRRQDKRRHMLEQIVKIKRDGCGINFEFYDAVDGTATETPFKCLNWFDPNSKKQLTKGEIGCALSHYHIWKMMVERLERQEMSESDLVMILEDDVVFQPGFQERLNQALAELDDQTADLIYLHRKPFDYNRERVISPSLRVPLRSYWTCGYLLSGRGARLLVESGYDQALIPVDEFLPAMYGISINSVVDEHFRTANKIQALAIYPSVLSLTEGAFNDSETFHSDPFIKPSAAYQYQTSRGKGSFMICYKGETASEYYQLFRRWCDVYGLPITLDENDSDYQQADLKLDINVADTASCSILPLTSAQELVEILLGLPKNSSVVLPGMSINTFQSEGAKTILTKQQYGRLIELIDDTSKITFDTKRSTISLTDGRSPAFVVSNGYSWVFRSIENYTGPGWNEYYGMRTLSLDPRELPSVYASVIVSKNQEISKIFEKIDYPQNKINLHIRKTDDTDLARYTALRKEIGAFKRSDQEYFLLVSHDCVMDRTDFLSELVKTGKRVIAPMIRGDGAFRNFWGALSSNGWYLRSDDYLQLGEMERKGIWQVPYISGVMLIRRDVIDQVPLFYQTEDYGNVDMVMCNTLRRAGIGLYLCNYQCYGHLASRDENHVELKDIHTTPNLRKAWEKKYLHPEMLVSLGVLQECPIHELADGIFNFPLFSQTFCQEMIELMERSKAWSAGRNNHTDPRLGENYYENHPTVDTQLFQVGLKETWDTIVKLYIAPVASHVYSNYLTKDVNLAFVVRYRYDEQCKLAPHHDSSAYTINVALNQGGVDYQGGGCRFLRQNLVVKNQAPGMCCMHPGRLTAYHEGLPVTSGTRYILVSFIN